MSNRPQTRAARWARAARNARTRLALGVTPILRRPNGDLARSEGHRNFQYGAQPGTHPSILTLHKRVTDEDRTPTVSDQREFFEQFTRDELRAEAKAAGLSNYGRLNKAGLVDLLVANR